jgi:hypothetical protein
MDFLFQENHIQKRGGSSDGFLAKNTPSYFHNEPKYQISQENRGTSVISSQGLFNTMLPVFQHSAARVSWNPERTAFKKQSRRGRDGSLNNR